MDRRDINGRVPLADNRTVNAAIDAVGGDASLGLDEARDGLVS